MHLPTVKQVQSLRQQGSFADYLLGQSSNAPNPFGCSFLLIDKTHNPTLKPFLSINKNRAMFFTA
jgi:hypothetical protein